MEVLWTIQHFYMQVDKRDKVELLQTRLRRRFSWSGFFNSLSDLGSAEEKLQYRVLRLYRSPVMSMSNTARSFWNASKTIS